MCLEKTIKERLTEIETVMENNRNQILELRKQNEMLEVVQDELQGVIQKEEKLVAKSEKTKLVAKKKPALKKATKKKVLSSGLQQALSKNRASSVSYDQIADAYHLLVNNSSGGPVLGMDLLTAVNSAIPNKKEHLNTGRFWGKIRATKRSPYPELAALFDVSGKPGNLMITLNENAYAAIAK